MKFRPSILAASLITLVGMTTAGQAGTLALDEFSGRTAVMPGGTAAFERSAAALRGVGSAQGRTMTSAGMGRAAATAAGAGQGAAAGMGSVGNSAAGGSTSAGSGITGGIAGGITGGIGGGLLR